MVAITISNMAITPNYPFSSSPISSLPNDPTPQSQNQFTLFSPPTLHIFPFPPPSPFIPSHSLPLPSHSSIPYPLPFIPSHPIASPLPLPFIPSPFPPLLPITLPPTPRDIHLAPPLTFPQSLIKSFLPSRLSSCSSAAGGPFLKLSSSHI